MTYICQSFSSEHPDSLAVTVQGYLNSNSYYKVKQITFTSQQDTRQQNYFSVGHYCFIVLERPDNADV